MARCHVGRHRNSECEASAVNELLAESTMMEQSKDRNGFHLKPGFIRLYSTYDSGKSDKMYLLSVGTFLIKKIF